MLCAFVAATNRHEREPAPDSTPGDAYAYSVMARAAPALPQEDLRFHHGQRLAIPYAVGLLHRATGATVHDLFRWVTVGLTAATLLIFASLLRALFLSHQQMVLAAALAAFNPWAFRYALTFPEMVNDLGFVMGLTVLTHGLLSGRGSVVLIGQLVASASRQTGLMLVPAVALWLWRDRARWGHLRARGRIGLALGCATVAAGVYLGTAALAARFASPDENLEHLIGLFTWARSSFEPIAFAAFLVRAALPLLIPVSLLLTSRGGAPLTTALLLFLSACVWIQPVLAGPDITEGNGARLVSLGMLPLYTAVALALRDGRLFAAETVTAQAAAMIALLALGSMHHWYVLAAVPAALHMLMFALAHLLAWIGCIALVRRERRRVAQTTSIAG